MIEDEIEPATLVEEPEEETQAEAPRVKSPWKAFILTGLLAGLLGAAGGAYGVYEGLKRLSPDSNMTAEIDLTPLENRLEALSDRVAAVEALSGDAEGPAMEVVDLSAVEARISALETAPKPDIDPAALSALENAQADGFEWPDLSALEARLTALETELAQPIAAEIDLPPELLERLSNIETQMEIAADAASNEIDADMMTALEARLSNLENRPPPEPIVERVSILAFPKDQLIEAVQENQSGNMLEKALSRHIRVKDANDPLTLIEGIEVDLSEGNLNAAAKKFESLPAPVQSAGQAWYESVKASL